MTTISVIIPTFNPVRTEHKIAKMCELQDSSTTVTYWTELAVTRVTGERMPPVPAMARAASHFYDSDILMFVHDDVDILGEGWNRQLALAFSLTNVGLVGFGGSPQLGVDDIYKIPYDLNQLARVGGFRSNMVEWERHGGFADKFEEVKALDGFCLAFSRGLYESMGGWEACPLPFHMYDAWACCKADQFRYSTFIAPVHCHHAGGGTSTTPEYEQMVKRLGYRDGQDLFEQAHRRIYNDFRGILPLKLQARERK